MKHRVRVVVDIPHIYILAEKACEQMHVVYFMRTKAVAMVILVINACILETQTRRTGKESGAPECQWQ